MLEAYRTVSQQRSWAEPLVRESEGPSFPEIESILLHNWLVVTRGIVEMLYLDFTCNNQ